MRLVGVSNCGRQSASMICKLRLHKVRTAHCNNLKHTFCNCGFIIPFSAKDMPVGCVNLNLIFN